MYTEKRGAAHFFMTGTNWQSIILEATSSKPNLSSLRTPNVIKCFFDLVALMHCICILNYLVYIIVEYISRAFTTKLRNS